jgi:8-oxo-dGTP pyrophosphatase MutT (NUDIX family)
MKSGDLSFNHPNPMAENSREPEAAVAILHATVPEDSVLLIRRAERADDPWSGHRSLPGGRRSFGDRDLLDTALRELEEECAIRLARDGAERALPHMFARRKAGRFLLVAPFIFRIETPVVPLPDPREAVEASWLPLRKILDPTQHSLRSVPNWLGETLFPAIDLNGVPLWRFTYRLLTEWLELTDTHSPEQLSAFQFADLVFGFLVSEGLVVQQGWTEPEICPNANEDPVVKSRYGHGPNTREGGY